MKRLFLALMILGGPAAANEPAMLRYFHEHRAAIESFKRDCKSELRRIAYAGSFDHMAKAA